jgi:hypothetical protein
MGGWRIIIKPSLSFEAWNEVVVRTAESFLYGNQSRDNSLALFGLEIGWDLARAFLM